MRVAVVRGPFLNPFDAAPYAAAVAVSAEAFSARRCYTEWDAVQLPVHRLRCPETELSLRRNQPLNLATWFFGHGYLLLGLERRLAGFDVINTAETYFGFSLQAAKAARRWGIPLTVTVKETIPDAQRIHPLRRRGLEGHTKAEVMRAADLFIAVSEIAVQALLQEGVRPDRIRLIRTAVDTVVFRPATRDDDKEARALFVGPVLWRKGIFEAIRAVGLLRRRSMIRLTVVGAGADLHEARRLSQHLHLEEQVKFLPRQAHRDMPALYRSSDFLLAPSIPTQTWQEQDSQAVVEAMASGLPVVSTLTGNRHELLGELGYWSTPGDYTTVAMAIDALLSDRDEAAIRGKELRARAERDHALAVVGAQLHDAHAGVLGHAAAASRSGLAMDLPSEAAG